MADDTQTETPDTAGAETPPDRLSNNPASPYFDMAVLQRGIGVRFKGRERRDVEEYSISEGWIRVQAGKSVDRRGMPVTVKLSGPVTVWFADVGEADDGTGDTTADDA